MSSHTATRLTLWGFGALYCSVRCVLVTVNTPYIPALRATLLFVLNVTALSGLAVFLVGRLTPLDDRGVINHQAGD